MRFDDPENNQDISFLYDEDTKKATEDLREFNLENFNTETSTCKEVKMVVGRTPTSKTRPCYFTISFTRNWESQTGKFIGGSFQFRFFHEVYESGKLKGLHASGEQEDQELKEISNEEAQKIMDEQI
jgi:hypothetical protein